MPAWIPQSRCYSDYGSANPICHPNNTAAYPLQGRCSVLNTSSTGYAGLDTWGGQYWVRTDCRDETNYIELNQPQIMLDNTMAQNDGYVDIENRAVTNPVPLGAWNANGPPSYHGSGTANGSGWNIAATGSYSTSPMGLSCQGFP